MKKIMFSDRYGLTQADSWQPTPEDIFAVDWKLVVPPTH